MECTFCLKELGKRSLPRAPLTLHFLCHRTRKAISLHADWKRIQNDNNYAEPKRHEGIHHHCEMGEGPLRIFPSSDGISAFPPPRYVILVSCWLHVPTSSDCFLIFNLPHQSTAQAVLSNATSRFFCTPPVHRCCLITDLRRNYYPKKSVKNCFCCRPQGELYWEACRKILDSHKARRIGCPLPDAPLGHGKQVQIIKRTRNYSTCI